jgi:hypothetical protein
MNTMLSRIAVLAAVLMLAAGCASQAPRYYSLADDAARPAALAVPGAAPLFIEFAPVAMPERFARPQMVVRQQGAADGPEVDILEAHRWASSFENELRDALASGVAGRLGAVDATKSGRARGHPVVRIAVQMRQFDAVENSRVDAGFSWTVRRVEDGPSVACQLSLSEPVDRGLDALARGAQRLTSKLADAIARSVAASASNPEISCPA